MSLFRYYLSINYTLYISSIASVWTGAGFTASSRTNGSLFGVYCIQEYRPICGLDVLSKHAIFIKYTYWIALKQSKRVVVWWKIFKLCTVTNLREWVAYLRHCNIDGCPEIRFQKWMAQMQSKVQYVGHLVVRSETECNAVRRHANEDPTIDL